MGQGWGRVCSGRGARGRRAVAGLVRAQGGCRVGAGAGRVQGWCGRRAGAGAAAWQGGCRCSASAGRVQGGCVAGRLRFAYGEVARYDEVHVHAVGARRLQAQPHPQPDLRAHAFEAATVYVGGRLQPHVHVRVHAYVHVLHHATGSVHARCHARCKARCNARCKGVNGVMHGAMQGVMHGVRVSCTASCRASCRAPSGCRGMPPARAPRRGRGKASRSTWQC